MEGVCVGVLHAIKFMGGERRCLLCCCCYVLFIWQLLHFFLSVWLLVCVPASLCSCVVQKLYLPVLEKDTVLRVEMFDHDAVNITSVKEMTALQVRNREACMAGGGGGVFVGCS